MTNKPERRFFVAAGRGEHAAIDTTALCDNRLSWKAKGLHYYIRTQMEALSNQQELVDAGPDGRDAVGSGIRELMHFKYLYMQQQRDENGQFVCALYTSFPQPVLITDEQLSTLMSTGSVPIMSTQNEPMSPPETENPDTVRSGADVMYYLTSLSINTNNKSLRDLSYSIKRRSAAPPPSGNFSSQQVDEIFNLWNSLPALPTHKKNPKYKKYNHCVRALKYALRTHEPEIISGAVKEYNALLVSPHTVLSKKQPMRVGLDEFFAFSAYSQTVVDRLKPGSPMHKIVSWFEECKKGSAYLLQKYSRVNKVKHPEVVRILEVELEMSTGWTHAPDKAWDSNSFAKAAEMLVAYREEHRKHLPHDYTPADLAVDLINMVSNFDTPHPGVLTHKNTWEGFGRYLMDLAIMETYERRAHHGFAATAHL